MTPRAKGFTLIEFMIAITLSLLVLAALTAAFVANSRSRTEIEKANEQMESGRFALQILTDDIEVAGFYSQFNIDIAEDQLPTEALYVPKGLDLPKPCLTAIGDADFADPYAAPADLHDAFPVHIQGYDHDKDTVDLTDAEQVDAGLDCLGDDVNWQSDIVVIRRTATCVAGSANCAGTLGAPYFQASLCGEGSELNTTIATNYYRIAAATDTDAPVAPTLDRKARNCADAAPARQLLTHIYFVARNDQDGDGVPTLKRAELTGDGADPVFTIVPLAHGIQDLQVEYGVDNVGGDGAPDEFKADPANVEEWRDVVTVRLSLLSRNSTPTQDHKDQKTYVLVDGVHGPFNDGYKRHAYQTTVRLMNPAGRREG